MCPTRSEKRKRRVCAAFCLKLNSMMPQRIWWFVRVFVIHYLLDAELRSRCTTTNLASTHIPFRAGPLSVIIADHFFSSNISSIVYTIRKEPGRK